MRREDLLQATSLSFGRPSFAKLATHEHSTPPSTMSFEHIRHPHTGEPASHHAGPHGHLLAREDGSSWVANPHAVHKEPTATGESLRPADPRLPMRERIEATLAHCKRLLGCD